MALLIHSMANVNVCSHELMGFFFENWMSKGHNFYDTKKLNVLYGSLEKMGYSSEKHVDFIM
jgi:hypothetical protein